MAARGKLSSLNDQLIQLVEQQKRLADEFTRYINDPKDGLKENTRRAIKNLDAAVVASKQPGYFKYHEASDTVKKVEQGNLLKKKLAEIKRVEKQIAHVREQMSRCEDERKSQVEARAATGSGGSVHSLKQWFNKYQRPDPVMFEPHKTQFVPSAKVYGGSAHYESFKSVASTMKQRGLTK